MHKCPTCGQKVPDVTNEAIDAAILGGGLHAFDVIKEDVQRLRSRLNYSAKIHEATISTKYHEGRLFVAVTR